MSNSHEKDSLAFLLNTAARLVHTAFERRIAETGLGLTPGEARTLLTIAAIDGSRQSEIAARMAIEPMTVCAYLDKLQSIDLIERRQDPIDRRSKRVMLTELSGTMLDAVRQELDQLMAQATAGMDEKEVHALRGSLKILQKNLQPEQPPEGSQSI
jgi:MarR family transcriptional regulator for hemolysin